MPRVNTPPLGAGERVVAPLTNQLEPTEGSAPADETLFSGQFDPSEALERLRARLLDLTRQNRLLHFRSPKGRSLQFVHIDIEATFRRLVNGDACQITWVPEPHKSDHAPGPRPEVREWATERLGWNVSVDLNPSRPDLPATGGSGRGLPVAYYPPECDRITRAIVRDARTAIEETGVNVLHLIFGFLEFIEDDASDKPLLAPLVAFPVRLDRAGPDGNTGFERYQVAYTGDDYSENLTLREKLTQQFRIALPTFEEGAGIEAYLEAVATLVHTRPGWKVHRRLTLGFLSFTKLTLWADLDLTKWPGLGTHKIIKALFQGNTSELGDELGHGDPQDHASYTELIFDADASQNRAVMDVLSGRNLVIDGPPGTGKSQTITNIIAAAMAAGKRVLFVAEKVAALQVVQRRLEQANLAPFLLELHSSKAQKKELLKNIAARLQAKFRHPADYSDALSTFRKRRDELQRYVALVNSVSGNCLGKTVFDVFWAADRRRAALEAFVPVLEALDYPAAPDLTPSERTELLSTGQRLAAHFAEVGDPSPDHPWFGFDSDRLGGGDEMLIAAILREHLRCAEDLLAGTAGLADMVQVEAGILSRTAVTAGALAATKVPEPPATLNPTLLVRLYPHDPATAQAAAATAQRFLAALNALHVLKQTAAACRLTETEATPERRQAVAAAAKVLATIVGAEQPLNQARKAGAALLDAARNMEQALAALAGSAHLAGIAFDGTEPHVTGVCAVAHVAQAAPRELLSWRHVDMAAPGAAAKLTALRGEHARLHAERALLEGLYFLDPEPPAARLPGAISVLRDADGIFAFLRGEVRAARRLYRRLARAPEKLAPRQCAERLADLNRFLSDRANFEESAAHRGLLGRLFTGMGTDLDAAQSLIDWCTEAQRRLAHGGNPPVDYIALPERSIALLADTAQQALDFARSLTTEAQCALEHLSPQRSEALSDLLRDWRALAAGLAKAGQDCSNACAILAEIGADRETPESLVAALDARAALPEARRVLDQDAEAARLLGPHFAGSDTALGPLVATLDWGRALFGSPLPGPLRHWVIDHDVRRRWPLLCSKTEELSGQWTELGRLPSRLAPLGTLDLQAWLGLAPGEDETAEHHRAATHTSLEAMDGLLPWVQYLAARKDALAAGLADFVRLLEAGEVPAARLTDAIDFVLFATIARALSRSHEALARFSTASHEQAREEFRRIDQSLKKLNGARLAHLLAQRDVPEGTAGYRPREYTDLHLLRHEIAKTRGHIAIRQLLDRAGAAVQALKPCWMMSPLSVAHYVRPGAVSFDLVLMDEASQIRPEEALGAIARGGKIVIVGDPNQLPPTTFFERAFESGETEDNEDEAGAAFAGTQSILDVVSQFYPTRQLLWHYRSHHHSLIDFSNVQFYEKRLIVFPSPQERHRHLGVTYHYVEGATYESRQNLVEANRVVDAVLEHARLRGDHSLGVATLNLTQRNLIEELLLQRLRSCPEPAWQAFLDKWEKGALGFFVKNLENVQGDERDVIYVSTTFGPARAGGRVHQRFGPIGTPTGWRRLNVLFTRARVALHLYTSLLPEDILIDETTRRGTVEFRNYLEYARDGRIATALPTEREPDSDFEVAVADLLRSRGYEVVPQLGVAGFFIDMAVRNPYRRGEYLAGIECDGATYHSGATVRDRDRLREQILGELGWKGRLFRIWSTDWFRNRSREAQKLLRFLEARMAEAQAPSPVPPTMPTPPTAPQRVAEPLAASTAAPTRASAPTRRGFEHSSSPAQLALALVDEAENEERYVEVGDIVTYEFADAPGKHAQVRIVDHDPDRAAGEVNENAPLARALLDLAVGDAGELHIPPQPTRKLRVLRVEAPKSRRAGR